MITFRKSLILTLSLVALIIFGIGSHQEAIAEIQYVSDLLIISVREGQNPEDPAVGYLPSATPVDVLEETEELMRIRTENGLEGWVRKKFIVAEKPKAIIINELEQQISELENSLQEVQLGSDDEGLKKMMQGYRKEIQAIQDQIQGYQKEIESLNTALNNEKKASAAHQNSFKEANAKYQRLLKDQKQNSVDPKKLAALKSENENLKKQLAQQPTEQAMPMLSANMLWFLIGGGVLILGFIIGRVVRRKPRYGY
jgi:SH3 domain protein